MTPASPAVRLARLVRTSGAAPAPASGLVEGTVVIEVGGARVTVARGAAELERELGPLAIPAPTAPSEQPVAR